MPYPKDSWAILPATDAIFNKTKVTLEEMMLEMGAIDRTGTILICERDNGYGKKPTNIALSSSGRMEFPVTFHHAAHHDQNMRPYGMLNVRTVIHYELKKGDDGKTQVVTEKAMPSPLTLDDKFPLFVFK